MLSSNFIYYAGNATSNTSHLEQWEKICFRYFKICWQKRTLSFMGTLTYLKQMLN